MRKISKRLFAAVGTLALLGAMMMAPEAQARPQYLKGFITKYPDLADAAKMKKCGMCHPKDKKMRLDYGKAVGSGLTKKNEKNDAAIAKAFDKAADVKSESSGKTFGEMIADGKLPE